MASPPPYELVVVGGGAGGLSAACTGARLGRRTALVQDGRPGGDCTFTGCVPSKTLIEAAARGRSFAEAAALMRRVVEEVAATENTGALANDGIEVIEGRGRFVGPGVLEVGGRTLSPARIVVATGSAPVLPPLPGLADISYLTNESVFGLERLPRSLAVLGGGAIGCELAQAFRRFGCEVHVIEAEDRLLPREEPEAGGVLGTVFSQEGIMLHLGSRVAGAEPSGQAGAARLLLAGGEVVEAERLLVAVGRKPVTAGLEPAAGGIELDDRGHVRTDRYLRTSARGVYAAGDVTGRLPFTHAADEMGRAAARNALRLRRSPFDSRSIPWVTFTDPEVARVGLSEVEAARRSRSARVAFLPMSGVDRALAADRREGFVKLIAGPRALLRGSGGGRVLGATIVGPRAGEMIHEVALAVSTGMFTGRLAQLVHAYPTWSTAVRQAAAQFFFEADGRRARPATGR